MAISVSGLGNSTAQIFQQRASQLSQASAQNQVQNKSAMQAVDSDGDNDHGAPESTSEQHIDVRA